MKACGISCVVGFAALVCFGYLALTGAAIDAPRTILVNELLAAAGFGIGLVSWLRIRRDA